MEYRFPTLPCFGKRLSAYCSRRAATGFGVRNQKEAMPKKQTRPVKKSKAAEGGAAAQTEAHVGIRLRHARISLRMKLRELAEKADCSESLLSKLENGLSLPSFATLQRIIDALGLTMGQLFTAAPAPQSIVSRNGQRSVFPTHRLRPGPDIKLEQLIPYDPAHLLEGSIHLIAPGAGGSGAISHVGEEVFYVIEGAIELSVADETYTLNVGDSAYFRSELPHTYKNLGPETARIIVINTPPTF
jgi:transcriptional regulator with XRE-family HTH domain